ncbi:hypothetical protein ANANG_G00317870 [Anguilla anguilla]|uniref:Uncharacterized protein n=1 Tax=Anguilla anguilla TaxID=7936 RepID=A0A9D3LL03_ANGAN|nr:hypothetical protein ANANG_G00317870 [Anguilla anguilla]
MAAMATEEGRPTASAVGQHRGAAVRGDQTDCVRVRREDGEVSGGQAGALRPRPAAPPSRGLAQQADPAQDQAAGGAASKTFEVQAGCEEAKSKLLEATALTEKLERELGALEEVESQADSSILEKLRALVAMNEAEKPGAGVPNALQGGNDPSAA